MKKYLKSIALRLGTLAGAAIASGLAITGTQTADNVEAVCILVAGIAADLIVERLDRGRS